MSLFLLLFASCLNEVNRDFDWQAEWNKHKIELKILNDSIYEIGQLKHGVYDFPDHFEFPFDDGYSITNIDNAVVLKYYTNRGLLDHYSAFVFTSDSAQKLIFDSEVANGGNDHFLEENWYYISN